MTHFGKQCTRYYEIDGDKQKHVSGLFRGRIKTFTRFSGVDGEKQKKSKVYLTKKNCDIGTQLYFFHQRWPYDRKFGNSGLDVCAKYPGCVKLILNC